MSNVCQGRYNEATERWEATYKGKVLASNRDRVGGGEYLRRVIEGGMSIKAKNAGVTKIEFDEVAIDETGAMIETPTVEKEFSINERFGIMEDYVDMVASRDLASALVTGEGGLGKTFTVMKSLRKTGLQDVTKAEIGAKLNGFKGYIVVKGYSTPKGLYRTLYENRDQIIIFDDCDSVLKDPSAVNVLKAALDSYDERIVNWNSEGGFGGGDDDLPKRFEFTGGVIFISNLPKNKIPQAIRSRAMCADVGMSRDEIIERMTAIVNSDEFMPEFELSHKLEALAFVAENAYNPMVQELNLRSLVNVIKARRSKPDTWRRLGLYSMANS
jgi:hypothetical protein